MGRAWSVERPTRFCIVTGMYPSRHDATDWFTGRRRGHDAPAPMNSFTPLSEVTVDETLKEHGYQTAFVGNWNLGDNEEYCPENQRFDVNVDGWA